MLCKIGEVEVWRLLDIHGPFMTPEYLFPNAGPDVSQIIERHVAKGVCKVSDRLILPIQGFLLITPHHRILIDSCVGNGKNIPAFPDWHMRSDGRFLAALAAAGLGVADVDYVLCTHLHSDHVGWNTQLHDGRWVPTFPNARYLMPAEDESVPKVRNSDLYAESVLPVIAAGQAEFFQDGHALGECVRLIPTPGHTPGHVSVRIASMGKEAIITGDALHTAAQCWHPEWHFRFDVDAEQAVSSRRKLLETASETDCIVLGSHFALPSIGRVKALNAAFCWTDLSDI
ncbi:MBL fold metallo-hydrolase [Marivita sp. XM-24bin2]|jgi:glyoxylase-like metal-dependent hydrolase (beta-lactamase superfamily II)|uniref:MBL fold metallo-hydrolase n=1 Tax=unclassified Marivita TaxID=2632480 RepID=UPI000D79CDAC|nr:MBL fold metallo-hydrolase [Marivita sp. XM-24bin2]MCR9108319.1 MBL fold metallo-hydrolase [Paracoccaceae bacterium]PWL36276.1 MAG: MBL fold metallo-hydrolase [Marivita sp. XM-24bin2]